MQDELLQRVREEFRELKWQDCRLVTEGWDHKVLVLDERLVFRFPNDEAHVGMLKNEIRLLTNIRPLVKVKIPEYKYIAKNGNFAGYPLIAGKQLTEDVFDQLPPDERDEIARQLAGFLTTLHSLVADGHDPSYVPGWDFMEEQKEVRQLAAKHLPSALSVDDYKLVQKMLDEVDSLETQTLPKIFLHGDIYSRHLLWDARQKKLGVIDFSDMTHGDPAYDFGELFEYGPKFVREVYDLYHGLKDESFLERAWTYQQWAAVNMMTDHFVVHKNSFEVARQTFDLVKQLL